MLAAIAWSALLAAPAQAADPVEIRNVSSDRYFSPNGDGREDLARVTYGLNVSATVDVTVRRRSLTIPRVTRGMRVTVQVRADGLLGGTPPNTTNSVKVGR